MSLYAPDDSRSESYPVRLRSPRKYLTRSSRPLIAELISKEVLVQFRAVRSVRNIRS